MLFAVFPEEMARRLQGLPKGSLEYAYSLTHSVAFAGYATEFLQSRGMPEETSPRVIRGNLRVQYLAFLQAKGLEGMGNFLHTFISSLMERRQNDMDRQRQQQPFPGIPIIAASAGSLSPQPLSGAAYQMRRGAGKVGADS